MRFELFVAARYLRAKRRQAVIGVNKYKPVSEAAIDVLKVENSTVRRLQIDKLRRLKRERDEKAVQESLAVLTRSAADRR
jgi:methylmalonyl-CoA mutase